MIRTLPSAGHAAFRDLRLQALAEHPVAFATTGAAWVKAPSERTIAFLEDSESASPSFVLGSFEDDQFTGMLGLRHEGRASVDHTGSFWGLYVRPELRGTATTIRSSCAARWVGKAVGSVRRRLDASLSCERAVRRRGAAPKKMRFLQHSGRPPTSTSDGRESRNQV